MRSQVYFFFFLIIEKKTGIIKYRCSTLKSSSTVYWKM